MQGLLRPLSTPKLVTVDLTEEFIAHFSMTTYTIILAQSGDLSSEFHAHTDFG